MKHIFALLFLIFSACFHHLQSQTIDKSYRGIWATTYWTFTFKTDGTYTRTSEGHFGKTKASGKYKIIKDTLYILSGNNKSYGTISDTYWLENDSTLIDLNMLYDYRHSDYSNLYSGRKRYDILKKPNMDSIIFIRKTEFDTCILNAISLLNSKNIMNFSDEQNIQIIRIINTLNMSADSIYNTGIYSEFLELILKKEYEKLVAIYYDWIPNRGMGFYFQKLQVELGGTPHYYSRYSITK